MAVDGNFQQRHNAEAGDCPPFDYDPEFLLPKAFVDAVGVTLDRKRSSGRVYTGEVPEAVLDDPGVAASSGYAASKYVTEHVSLISIF